MIFIVSPHINADAGVIPDSAKVYFHIQSSSNISSYDANFNVIGTVYPSDECWTTMGDIYNATQLCKVHYPTANGEKTAYIPYQQIWNGVGGCAQQYISSYKRTTYWRKDMTTSFGSIYANDLVTIMGTSGNVTQVLYPVSKGYKLGWIYSSHVN